MRNEVVETTKVAKALGILAGRGYRKVGRQWEENVESRNLCFDGSSWSLFR